MDVEGTAEIFCKRSRNFPVFLPLPSKTTKIIKAYKPAEKSLTVEGRRNT